MEVPDPVEPITKEELEVLYGAVAEVALIVELAETSLLNEVVGAGG